jgi:hypothetical protein
MRKNQEEHGPEVWRNHQETISRWRNEPNQTSPQASHPVLRTQMAIPDPPELSAVLTRHSGWQKSGERACAADFSLLNLPKGKSLGRSKPATNS